MAAGFLNTLISAYLIIQWIFFSSCVILFNKSLISGGFNHPITIVMLHMAFGSLASTLWRGLGLETVPNIGFRMWLCGFLPVGVCFAGSLCVRLADSSCRALAVNTPWFVSHHGSALSNMAYAYISVAYIQMIKASTPVVVLLLSFCFGIEQPSCRLVRRRLLPARAPLFHDDTRIESPLFRSSHTSSSSQAASPSHASRKWRHQWPAPSSSSPPSSAKGCASA